MRGLLALLDDLLQPPHTFESVLRLVVSRLEYSEASHEDASSQDVHDPEVAGEPKPEGRPAP